MNYNLSSAVYRQSITNPQNLAVAGEGRELTYGQFARKAAGIAACLRRSRAWSREDGKPPRVGILASRSVDACLAVLGASWAGATYIPIGTKLPEERLLTILSLCNLSAIVADADGAKLLSPAVLSACPPLVVLPSEELRRIGSHGAIEFYAIEADSPVESGEPALMRASDPAYIIFTSGTTGVPKGVIIACGAIRHYVEVTCTHLGLQPTDRAIETLELTFDVSLHDMFTTWEVGASLHILPATRVMSAVKFVNDHRLTVWFSVPSLVGMLKQIRVLAPNAMPTLRVTVFGGEQLPEGVVKAWQAAAPNSIIENFYGPTEATVFILTQSVAEPIPLSPGRDCVSIGLPLPGNEAAIVSVDGQFLSPGDTGELALAGIQLSDGYLDAPELTARRFPMLGGKRWYLTGDLALQDAAGRFHCLGRIDNQVKVLGHRIELEEVDAQLRRVSGAGMAATVAWPLVDGIAQGLVGFVGAQAIDAPGIIAAMKTHLPAYMVPGRVLAHPEMPLNQSGKVDRRALLQHLEGHGQRAA